MSARLLIIDDSPTVLVATSGAMRLEGFSVAVVANAVDALDVARAERPDVILLDVVMARASDSDLARGIGGGGFQLLGRLRADMMTRLIPVVMWTAALRESTERAARGLGAAALLQKGIDAAELALVLRRAMGSSA